MLWRGGFALADESAHADKIAVGSIMDGFGLFQIAGGCGGHR